MTTQDDPRQADLVLAAVMDLVVHIEDRLPLLTSRLGYAARQHAAAALSRGTALIRSGVATVRAGEPAAAGLIARAAWECYLVGLFLLCGGQRSLHRLQYEQLRQNRNVGIANDLDVARIDADMGRLLEQERDRQVQQDDRDPTDVTPVTLNGPTIEQMARETSELVEKWTGEPADVLGAYKLFYRTHSAWDTHGVQALRARLEVRVDLDRIELKQGTPWLKPHKPIASASSYLAVLADLVFKEFGVSTEGIGDRQVLVLGLMRTLTVSDDDGWSEGIPPISEPPGDPA